MSVVGFWLPDNGFWLLDVWLWLSVIGFWLLAVSAQLKPKKHWMSLKTEARLAWLKNDGNTSVAAICAPSAN